MIAQAPPPGQASCLHSLPRAPVGLPARVALDAGCALVVLAPGGHVSLRPRPAVPETEGAQLAPGDGIAFRGRHAVRIRRGIIVWRSSWTFSPGEHAGTFTTISDASGRGDDVAYVVSRWSGKPRDEHRLVFVTDGAGPEHRLQTTAYPLGWSSRGLVTASARRGHLGLRVWNAAGRPVGAPLVFAARAWAWDWTLHRVVVATGVRVLGSDGLVTTPLGRTARLGFGPEAHDLSVSPLGHGVVELSTPSRLAVLDARGTTIARTTLPDGWRLDGSIAADAGGTVAYEATPVSRATARHFRLYASVRGAAPRVLDRYDTPPSCVYDGLAVRGSVVLLAGNSVDRVYDAGRAGSRIDLEPAVRWLGQRHRTGVPRFA